MKQLLALLFASLISSVSLAQARWDVGTIAGNEGVYAAAFSDSGALFGHYCYYSDDSCLWVMSSPLTCVEGDSHPALVSGAGAQTITLVCAGKSGVSTNYRYILSPYDTINELVKASSVLGVAMVSESGTFRVQRFDLRDSRRALREAVNQYNRNTKGKIRDQIL